jgi:hypothetical protein
VKGVALALVAPALAAFATTGGGASAAPARCTKTVVVRAAFSPDSRWVAALRQRDCDALPSLTVVNATGGRRRTVARGVVNWSWAPKGDRLAVESISGVASSLFVTAPSGKRLVRVSAATAFAWAPNGRALAVRQRDPEDIVVAAVTGAVRKVADAPLGTFLAGQALQWSPDGASILYTAAGEGPMLSIRLVGADGSGDRELARGSFPVWSPDGSRVLFDAAPGGVGTGVAHAWATIIPDGGERRAVGPANSGAAASWAPRGAWMSFAVPTQSAPETWVDTALGGALRDLGPGTPVWSPSGARLALAGSTVSLLDPDGTHRAPLPYGGTVAWAPRGRSLVVADARGRVHLVRSSGTGGRVIAAGRLPDWSPSGRLVTVARRRACGDDVDVVRLATRREKRVLSCRT